MNWLLFNPELYFLLMGVVFLALSMTSTKQQNLYLAALAMAAVGVGVCLASVYSSGDLFYNTYRVDLFSQVFKVLLSLGLFLIISICSSLDGVDERYHAEFYLLLTLTTLAMMMLVSCIHLLTVYVALELSSYSLYLLVSLRSPINRGTRTALNYFLIGATASAIMIFGLALLYGAAQTMHLSELMTRLPGMLDQPAVIMGMVMTLCGFFFKLAVFPFHFWAPDVYEGAPHQVAAYVSTASKVAAIAILVRMTALAGDNAPDLVHCLVVLSIVSMTVGNLAALVQKDFKRLLAFSSIAHAGYVLIGILSMSPAGYASVVFYALAVLLMKFTCFLVVVVVAHDGQNPTIEQLAGLHRRSPILALALMMALFGLAGIPPTIGFTGKLLVFLAAVAQGHLVLVLIAMFNVLISLYYYLQVLKAAYLLEPQDETLAYAPVQTSTRVLAGVLVTAMVLAGIYPTYLINIALAAITVLV